MEFAASSYTLPLEAQYRKIVPTSEIQASLVPTLDLHRYHTLYKSAPQVQLHSNFLIFCVMASGGLQSIVSSIHMVLLYSK